MSATGWDVDNEKRRKLLCDEDGILRTKPEGVYLAVPPALANNEQHRLTMTDDAKLRVDDPTTQALVQDIIDDITDATHGLAALETLVDDLETRLTAVRAGYLDELDFDLDARLGTPIGASLAADLLVIHNYVDELEGMLESDIYGLAEIKRELIPANLLTNPGFETGDTTGWNGAGDGSWSVQGVTVKHGSYAAKIEPDINKSYYINTTPTVPCYPGQRRRAYVYLKADANITESRLRIYWRRIDGSGLPYTESVNYGGNYDWTFRELIATAPDEAYFCFMLILFRSGGTAGVGYVDSCNLPQMGSGREDTIDEIEHVLVHVSEVWPDEPSRTCTVTSGAGADTWGAWANLVDNALDALSLKFAADDGHITGILVEECSSTDNPYHLEIRDNVSGETLCRSRFTKANVRLDVGHSPRVLSLHIAAGADIEYRMKDANGGETADISIRYYLV